jgi:hypothetical protein
VLELVAWHRLKGGVHPKNTRLLNAMHVRCIAGRGLRLPLFDPSRNHAVWLRAQLSKHGAIGRALVAAFKSRCGVDVRDQKLVRDAFSALQALAATAAAASDAAAVYAPPPPAVAPLEKHSTRRAPLPLRATL